MIKKTQYPVCDSCKNKKCREGKDCFSMKETILNEYQGDSLKLARVSSSIEGEYYMEKTRIEELILFCREIGFKKLGIAFCIGLSEEAKQLADYLRNEFKVVSVCCKVCGIEKNKLHLQKIDPDSVESMCNPIGQAILLNNENTDLNIICGLCIGHDIQFASHSDAPVTTFIVKDRILAHNTAASLYNPYLRKRIGLDQIRMKK
jgi:uncharacterized metal-binding protein